MWLSTAFHHRSHPLSPREPWLTLYPRSEDAVVIRYGSLIRFIRHVYRKLVRDKTANFVGLGRTFGNLHVSQLAVVPKKESDK